MRLFEDRAHGIGALILIRYALGMGYLRLCAEFKFRT
jgi:hypothetical protein